MTLPYFIIAFHTTDPLYTGEAARLKESLDRFHLPYRIRSLPPFRSWQDAVAFKARFILDMLSALTEDVLYVDADARFNEHPELFDAYPHEIGVFFRPEMGMLFGATIYFKNNDRVKRIVKMWMTEQAKDEKANDQKLLQVILDREMAAKTIDVGCLPESYCCKIDSKSGCEKVIEQFQASRRAKPQPPRGGR